MLRRARHLLVLLCVTSAVAQTPEETTTTSFPGTTTPVPTGTIFSFQTRCRDGTVMVRGECRRMWTPGQRPRFLTSAAPSPTLDEGPLFEPSTTQSPQPTLFNLPDRCPDGFVSVRGRCRRILTRSDAERGPRQELSTLGQPSGTAATAAAAPISQETSFPADVSTTETPTTIVVFPTRCRDGYVIVAGQCRRMWTPGQRPQFLTSTAPNPTLDERPLFEPSTMQSPLPTESNVNEEVFKLPDRCPDGSVSVRGSCRVLLTRSDAERRTQTPANIAVSSTRCRDGYVMVRGRCRISWAHFQRNRLLKRTAPNLTLEEDQFLKPTADKILEPTMSSSRDRCGDGFVLLRGRCRKIVPVPDNTDSAPQGSGSDAEATRKPATRGVCPRGSKFRFGMCLTPVVVRLVSLPKRCPDGYVLVEDSCSKKEAVHWGKLVV